MWFRTMELAPPCVEEALKPYCTAHWGRKSPENTDCKHYRCPRGHRGTCVDPQWPIRHTLLSPITIHNPNYGPAPAQCVTCSYCPLTGSPEGARLAKYGAVTRAIINVDSETLWAVRAKIWQGGVSVRKERCLHNYTDWVPGGVRLLL